MTKKNKRNTKNSFKMTFKRWGTLVPQEHLRDNDFYCYHDTPVKMGIFAFPEKLASRRDVCSPCISNGREQYVKDEDGKKYLMTKKEFEDLETKRIEKYGFYHYVAISHKYLRGLYYLNLQCDNICDGREEMEYDEAYDAWPDDERRYPITAWRDRLVTFSYGGNIWHHWIRTNDGIKEDIQLAYFNKDVNKNYDLEGALNIIITGQYGEEYGFGHKLDRKIKRLVKPEDIIRRSGSWILTDMRTNKKALEKAVHVAKYEEFMRLKAKGEVEGFPMGLPKREIAPTLFEVYIERVQ